MPTARVVSVVFGSKVCAIASSLKTNVNVTKNTTTMTGAERRSQAEENAHVTGAVDLRGLVDLDRDRVEEALDQVGVDAQEPPR